MMTEFIQRNDCGSFQKNGHKGTESDYILHTFLSCSDPPRYPDKIVMAGDVYGMWFDARVRAAGRPDITTWTEARNAGIDVQHYQSAVVEVSEALSPGVMLFYWRGHLVGEATGWTA